MAVGIWLKIYPSGRKNAVKYADEIIVLSKGVQDYFKETYGRETHFIPNGVNRPQIRETNLITEKFGLKKDSYILFLGRLVPEKGIRYLVEAFKNVKTDKKLVIAGGSSDTDSFMEELKELAKGDNRILFTGFVQGAMLDELYSNKDMNKFVFIYAWISGWCAVCLFCMRTSCLRAGEVWASILPALEGQTAGCTWTYAKKRAGGGGDANGDHPFCHHCRSGDADRRIDRKFKIQCGHGVQDRGTDPRSAQAQRLCGEDPCDPERHSGAQSQDDRYRNT